MLGQFIQVISGATPVAVVLALAFAQVKAASRGRIWATALVWGVAGGGAAGIALTVLRETTTLVNRETVNLWTVAPAVALELWFVAWMWAARQSRRSRQPAHDAAPDVGPGRRLGDGPGEGADGGGGVATAAAALGLMSGLVTLRAVPAVALQLTGFVVPGESPASTEMLLRVLGFAGGAALVWVAALTLCRSAVGSPRGARLACSTLAFAIMAAFQLVLVLRAVRAQWYMTFPSWLFRAMAWLINHEALETAALIAASAAIPLTTWALARRRPSVPAAQPAAARLRKAAARRRRRYSGAVLLSYAAMALTVTVGVAIENRGPQLSPPEPFEIADGLALIPLDLIDDGHLHRFAYTTPDGTVVRFIVIKKNGVAYGVGLDACEVCGDTGYYEKDGKIICRLCDVVMNIATIGFKGGCNPIPLDYDISDATLTVSLADLEAGAGHFA
ncbi:MAG: DUF2318 domain-containing protein [Bifidobacteriaceae bacterium]|nr:DUF2318 domain-containing protein [Bifidobacteriaceae bacterium]